jgi:hypothetical protein
MRPVPTWKSTDAAPTPMSVGASLVPSRLSPWQLAQLAAKSLEPSSTAASWLAEVSAVADVVKSAYAPPVLRSPMRMSATLASG